MLSKWSRGDKKKTGPRSREGAGRRTDIGFSQLMGPRMDVNAPAYFPRLGRPFYMSDNSPPLIQYHASDDSLQRGVGHENGCAIRSAGAVL